MFALDDHPLWNHQYKRNTYEINKINENYIKFKMLNKERDDFSVDFNAYRERAIKEVCSWTNEIRYEDYENNIDLLESKLFNLDI